MLLAEVAPELEEWAAFFAAGREQAGGGRGRVDRGRSPSARPTTWSVTPTGSSAVVEQALGLVPHLPFSGRFVVPTVAGASGRTGVA